MNRHALLLLTALVSALTGAACGNNPASPSGAVVVRGTVLDATAGMVRAQSGGAAVQSGGGGRITVTLQGDPSITTTVSGNGTFLLEGLPPGSFMLVFTRDGVTLGTVTVSGVGGGAEVKIVVQVNGSTLVVIELKIDDKDASTDQAKTCLINGGRPGDSIELEGHVASGTVSAFKLDVNGNRASGLVDVSTSGPSSYQCVGQTKGTCPPDPLVGTQVHVSGTLTSCSLSAALVTATEVKVQKP